MVTAAGARRELEDMRSAINHHRREGLCSEIVSVALPDQSDSPGGLVNPSEAAAASLGSLASEDDGARARTRSATWASMLLVSSSSDSIRARDMRRSAAPHSNRRSAAAMSIWIRGVFYRRRSGRPTNEKAATAGSSLPTRLLAHLRRWERARASRGTQSSNGTASPWERQEGFRGGCGGCGNRAGAEHHAAHLCATRRRPGRCRTAPILGRRPDILGMTVGSLERVYGHHHPDFQS